MTKFDFGRFFVASDSPVEFSLSRHGEDVDTMKSGAELETNETTLYGTVQYVKYNVTKGTFSPYS